MRTIGMLISVIMFTGLAGTGIQAQSMYVREKTGNVTTYSVDNLRKLTFIPGKLSVSKSVGNTDEYLLEELRFLTFSDVIIGTDHPDRDDLQSGFRIFPNPVKSFLTIASPPHTTLNGRLEVVNFSGNVLKSLEVSHADEFIIDLRDLADGIYTCRFRNVMGWYVGKFIKQH